MPQRLRQRYEWRRQLGPPECRTGEASWSLIVMPGKGAGWHRNIGSEGIILEGVMQGNRTGGTEERSFAHISMVVAARTIAFIDAGHEVIV